MNLFWGGGKAENLKRKKIKDIQYIPVSSQSGWKENEGKKTTAAYYAMKKGRKIN